MMNIRIRKKPMLAALIFAAAITAIVFLAIMPAIAALEGVGDLMREQQDKIAGYEKKIQAARDFAVFRKAEKSNMEKIGQVFVDAKMPLDFINSLETLARDAAVKLDFSSSVQPQKGAKEQPAISIEADVSGSLPGLRVFLEKIESSPYLVQIMAVNMQIEEGEAIEAPAAESASTTEAAETTMPPVVNAKAHILLKAYAK
ncbi:MAG: hypothetical protein MUD10_04755 [Candidatus Pacebacteria bacterium]|jgi:hypothetical protein|nr:hypothetical protein [Candidatus Paceibacterota bacterium]